MLSNGIPLLQDYSAHRIGFVEGCRNDENDVLLFGSWVAVGGLFEWLRSVDDRCGSQHHLRHQDTLAFLLLPRTQDEYDIRPILILRKD